MNPNLCKKILEADGIIGFPTDTVYGLAVKAGSQTALKALYELKQRPLDKAIILLLDDLSQLEDFFEEIPESFYRLSKAFWPGALSLILDAKENGRSPFPSLGIRIPNHKEALELLRMTGPLFVSSANLSGESPALSDTDFQKSFGKDFPLLKSQTNCEGLASTVLKYESGKWLLLREGSLSPEKLLKVLKPKELQVV